MSDIKDLENAIKHYSVQYYRGKPLISDKEFDSLVEQLSVLDPENRLLHTVGWGAFELDDPGEARHLLPEPVEGMVKFKGMHNAPTDSCYITPKIDGGSAVVYYLEGRLAAIVTRGNGRKGQDITRNLRHAVPATVPFKGMFAARGEVCVSLEDFEDLKDKTDYSNPRNMAVGVSQSDDRPEFVPYLKFVAYSSNYIKDRRKATELLLSFGFDIPEVFDYNPIVLQQFNQERENSPSITDFSRKSAASQIYNHKGQAYHILVDGLVLDRKSGIIAYKFEDETKETMIRSIDWNLTRTGKLVPTVIFDTVNIDGVNVSRASMTSLQLLEDTECGIGAQVEVIRANGVIPHVENILVGSTHFDIPETCPACNAILHRLGANLVCENENCQGHQVQPVLRFLEWVMEGTKGVGQSVFWEIIEELDIASLSDIEKLDCEQVYLKLKPLLGPITFEKVYKALQKKLFGDYYPTAFEYGYLTTAPSVGEVKIKALEDSVEAFIIEGAALSWPWLSQTGRAVFEANLTVLKRIFGGRYRPKEVDTKQGIKVCITGKTLTGTKKDWFASHSNTIESSISDCDVLIANDQSKVSSKMQEAQKKDIKILTEQEFDNEYGSR